MHRRGRQGWVAWPLVGSAVPTGHPCLLFRAPLSGSSLAGRRAADPHKHRVLISVQSAVLPPPAPLLVSISGQHCSQHWCGPALTWHRDKGLSPCWPRKAASPLRLTAGACSLWASGVSTSSEALRLGSQGRLPRRPQGGSVPRPLRLPGGPSSIVQAGSSRMSVTRHSSLALLALVGFQDQPRFQIS